MRSSGAWIAGPFALGGAVLGNMVDGYGVVAIAVVGKAIEHAWGLGPALLGLVFAAGPAGMMLGSLILAPFADRIGRRRIALTSLLLVAGGMFGAAAASSVAYLLAMLLVTGLGIGGALASLNTVVAEIAPPARRNMIIALFSAGYPLGSTLAGALAIGLLAAHGWQIVFVAGSTLALLAFLVNLLTLPEPECAVRSRAPRGRGHPADASQRRRIAALCLAFFLNMTSFYFILLWTARLSTGDALPETSGVTATTIVNIGGLVGPMIFGFLADRFGLPRMARLYFLIFAGAIALFSVAGGVLWALYAVAALVGLAMAGAMTSLYASTPLLFSPQARAGGTGLAIGIGRLGASVGPLLAGVALQGGVSRAQLYLLFALPPLLVAPLLRSVHAEPRRPPTSDEA